MVYSVVNILGSVVEKRPLLRSLKGLKFYVETRGVYRGRRSYRIGNSVVVFKVRWRGEQYAMRCYMKGGAHLREIYGDGYYPAELCVEEPFTMRESWIDVVMCRWEGGESLSCTVAEAVRRDDRETLASLSHNFDILALEMLRSEWSHGDLSGENIIVTPSGELRLIDFDSKFLPEFEGEVGTSRGTQAYQSPRRGCEDFNRHTDDFSLALISTALKMLSIDPSIYNLYPYEDGLLFNPVKIARGECRAFSYTKRLLLEMGLIANYRIAEVVERCDVCAPDLDIYFRELVESEVGRYPLDVDDLHVTICEGRCGYSNRAGETVIAHLYDEALEFKRDHAMVKADGVWFFTNRYGSSTVCCGEFNEVHSFNGNRCHARRNNGWGVLFRDGKFVN
ncbi:MAG: WG repeat-containing protein [Rikenellaceae bacterium]